ELQDPRDGGGPKARVRMDGPLSGNRRDLHADSHRDGHAPVPHSIWLQAGPEAGVRWCAAWLEDDGPEAGRPTGEVLMNWSKWIRQAHRWLSVAFTACVIANIVVNAV